MSILKKISGAGAALLLACGLLAPMAAWAEDYADAYIELGRSGERLTVQGVDADATSLRLELTVAPKDGATIQDLAFTPAIDAKVSDVQVDPATGNVQVVLSAGTDRLFPDGSSDVKVGTLSATSPEDGAVATVTMTRFVSLDGTYARDDRDVEAVTADYKVNQVADGTQDPDGNGGSNGNGSGNGSGDGNGASTTQTGYGTTTQAGGSNLAQTGDVLKVVIAALVVVAAAAVVAVVVRGRMRAKRKGE